MYDVFVRSWFRKTRTGIEPHAGRKTYLRRGLSYEEARQLCAWYNCQHKPGSLSRKAEFRRVE